jgi:hypothetical protein
MSSKDKLAVFSVRDPAQIFDTTGKPQKEDWV